MLTVYFELSVIGHLLLALSTNRSYRKTFNGWISLNIGLIIVGAVDANNFQLPDRTQVAKTKSNSAQIVLTDT